MFIAAMSTIAKLRKEHRCPMTNEGINNMWYKIQWNSWSHQKNEMLPFTMRWVELEEIMLSEISQSEKDNYQIISLIYGIRETRQRIIGEERKK